MITMTAMTITMGIRFAVAWGCTDNADAGLDATGKVAARGGSSEKTGAGLTTGAVAVTGGCPGKTSANSVAGNVAAMEGSPDRGIVAA